MPTDYGALGLIEAGERGRNAPSKSLFNVSKSYNASHEIPTNLQLKNKMAHWSKLLRESSIVNLWLYFNLLMLRFQFS